ncbi:MULTISPECIES: DUF4259 domain-containing protein [unclassified Streptomyces]|uniref:DUF4259 domain-containing protein n=1 Tax=unclassified Streptomyces TaxID=2593676 RepID=UPI0036F18A4A
MGTWGTGPFQSDLADDFKDWLHGLPPQEAVAAIKEAFQRVIDSGSVVDGEDGAEAVAAAAYAIGHAQSGDIPTNPEDGPERPLPEMPEPVRAMARQALGRVLGDGSKLAQGWVDLSTAAEWRQEVQLILCAFD